MCFGRAAAIEGYGVFKEGRFEGRQPWAYATRVRFRDAMQEDRVHFCWQASHNEWAAELLTQEAGVGDGRHWVDQFLEIAERGGGDSRGRKWTREELYER